MPSLSRPPCLTRGSGKTLFEFQKDGVKGAINKILAHNGCIIADSVGLGKTYEALAIIKYFELRNDRVLVLCPKKLRDKLDRLQIPDFIESFHGGSLSFRRTFPYRSEPRIRGVRGHRSANPQLGRL